MCGLPQPALNKADYERKPMYAIIEDSGTQIKVSPDDVIKVDKRDLADDAIELAFDKVMMISDEGAGEPRIGQPLLEGAKVTGEILLEDRLPKVEVIKFKKRKGYRRRRGHRQPYLLVKITGIEG